MLENISKGSQVQIIEFNGIVPRGLKVGQIGKVIKVIHVDDTDEESVPLGGLTGGNFKKSCAVTLSIQEVGTRSVLLNYLEPVSK